MSHKLDFSKARFGAHLGLDRSLSKQSVEWCIASTMSSLDNEMANFSTIRYEIWDDTYKELLKETGVVWQRK